MNDLIMITIRFLLYLDLMVIFGLPFFEIYGVKISDDKNGTLISFRSFILFSIITGLLLTFINMLLVSNTMIGVTDVEELSVHIIEMVIEETDVGISWVIRLLALCVALSGIPLYAKRRKLSCLIMALSGSAALITLAWGGHAVMHSGKHYYLHLLSDGIHLIAAGAWVGALAAFAILLLYRAEHNRPFIEMVSDSLKRFATPGTFIVIALIVSAAINYWYIADGRISALFSGVWGGLLLAKSGLFMSMLLLAAANRFHLGPKLEQTIVHGEFAKSLGLMRRSILTEFFLAIMILAAVAWLGTLSPTA